MQTTDSTLGKCCWGVRLQNNSVNTVHRGLIHTMVNAVGFTSVCARRCQMHIPEPLCLMSDLFQGKGRQCCCQCLFLGVLPEGSSFNSYRSLTGRVAMWMHLLAALAIPHFLDSSGQFSSSTGFLEAPQCRGSVEIAVEFLPLEPLC